MARLSGDALSATKDISVAYEQLQFTPELVEELAGWGAMSGPSVSSEYSRLPTDEENSAMTLVARDPRRSLCGWGEPGHRIG